MKLRALKHLATTKTRRCARRRLFKQRAQDQLDRYFSSLTDSVLAQYLQSVGDVLRTGTGVVTWGRMPGKATALQALRVDLGAFRK